MFDNRISIFTGHFGSGKTEVAVNYAVKLAQMKKKTAIVDFDIVNPYFRTADVKSFLEQKDIYVITPLYANTNVDVPALPGDINAIFEKKEYSVVFDVGGDDLGARVLARYNKEIVEDDYEMFFVINVKRPMTDTPDRIEEMIDSIEYSSKLKVTKLVNNTNLLQYTREKDILEGMELIREVSAKLKIPIGFSSFITDKPEKLEKEIGTEVLGMDKLIKLPWD
ncbi:MAG: hypothetical protein N3I35_16980 [Clostridia bacterium]|nr:hypothetical protein [Clostridia bacterium]